MRILDDVKLDFDDVLIMPQRSSLDSRIEVELMRRFEKKQKNDKLTVAVGTPIIAANMDTTGSFTMANAIAHHGAFTCLHKHYAEKELIDFWTKSPYSVIAQTFYTLGITDSDLNKLEYVLAEVPPEKHPQMLCVDVANGYTDYFVDRVRTIREKYQSMTIMAGNVVTREMTQELIQRGQVDIVKLGIGPGSVCETRKKTGVGYPQLSCIIECADAAHQLGALVCADGGCKESGDVAKAICAGADFVMLGGMLAGTDECEGEWEMEYECIPPFITFQTYGSQQTYEQICDVTVTGKKVKKFLKFHGMSSEEAMKQHNGGMAEYRASEGKEILVPYKGPVEQVIQKIYGGLRSTGTYIGADKIKDFSKKATFVRVK